MSDSYSPPYMPRSRFLSLIPGATARFYWGMFYAVWCARRLAQQHAFDDAALRRISDLCARYAEWCGARLHCTGLEVIAATPGPVVFVANHMSSMETFLLPGIIIPYKPLGFVIKDSLTRHSFFGPVMRSTRYVAVTRANPRHDLQAVLEQGTEALQNKGTSFCIFPTATREYVFDEAKFNTLGVKLARRAKVPVIPLAIKTDFWGNGKWIKDFGSVNPKAAVRFAFGPALPPSLPQADMHRQVVAFIREHLESWGVPCRRVAAETPCG